MHSAWPGAARHRVGFLQGFLGTGSDSLVIMAGLMHSTGAALGSADVMGLVSMCKSNVHRDQVCPVSISEHVHFPYDDFS